MMGVIFDWAILTGIKERMRTDAGRFVDMVAINKIVNLMASVYSVKY